MKTVKIALNNLRRSEKVVIVISVLISIGMSYQAIQYGLDVISIQVIGPSSLMAFCVYSLLLVGIIRGRSMAMNTLFVALMIEARDAKNRLGEELDPASVKLVADFLGDNK